MNKTIQITAGLLALTLAACASSADEITPAYVNPAQFDGLTCAQVLAEQSRVQTELSGLSDRQDDNADGDTAMVAAGILLWPIWLGVAATNDYEEQIAALKGAQAALRQTALNKQCALPAETEEMEMEEEEGDETQT